MRKKNVWKKKPHPKMLLIVTKRNVPNFKPAKCKGGGGGGVCIQAWIIGREDIGAIMWKEAWQIYEKTSIESMLH